MLKKPVKTKQLIYDPEGAAKRAQCLDTRRDEEQGGHPTSQASGSGKLLGKAEPMGLGPHRYWGAVWQEFRKIFKSGTGSVNPDGT